MQLVTDSISLAQLKTMAERMFGNLVKAVVDIEKGIMVVDAATHAEEEAFLVEEQKSDQRNLWGINLYPEESIENWIGFETVINVRPSQKNMGLYVEDPYIRTKIVEIITKLVPQ